MFLLFFTSLGTHLRSKEFWQVFLEFVPIQTHRAVCYMIPCLVFAALPPCVVWDLYIYREKARDQSQPPQLGAARLYVTSNASCGMVLNKANATTTVTK